MRAQDAPAPRSFPGDDEIEAARFPYTQCEARSENAHNNAANDRPATDGTMRAQLSRRGQRMPPARQTQYPRRSYPKTWPELGNSRGAAIGALVGGGLGVGLGLAITDQHPRAKVGAALIFGGLGAVIGAVAGGTFPSRSWRNHVRPWQDEDDIASSSQAPAKKQAASPRPAASAVLAKIRTDTAKSREIPEPAKTLGNEESPRLPAASQMEAPRDSPW